MRQMTPAEQRWFAAGVMAVVILLLLLVFGRRNTVINQAAPLAVNVDAPDVSYSLPGLPGRPGGAWDWMQTTDCACACDEGTWTAPLGPRETETVTYPEYVYISQPVFAAGATIPPMAVYTPPPPPTWWYEWGHNVHHEQASYVVTSDGIVGILGKYNRSSYMEPAGTSFPQQTKNVAVNGNDAYINGKHYVHDASRDESKPPPDPVAASSLSVWGG